MALSPEKGPPWPGIRERDLPREQVSHVPAQPPGNRDMVTLQTLCSGGSSWGPTSRALCWESARPVRRAGRWHNSLWPMPRNPVWHHDHGAGWPCEHRVPEERAARRPGVQAQGRWGDSCPAALSSPGPLSLPGEAQGDSGLPLEAGSHGLGLLKWVWQAPGHPWMFLLALSLSSGAVRAPTRSWVPSEWERRFGRCSQDAG